MSALTSEELAVGMWVAFMAAAAVWNLASTKNKQSGQKTVDQRLE